MSVIPIFPNTKRTSERSVLRQPDPRLPKLNVTGVATIAGTSTVVPPHLLTRETVKDRIGEVFSLQGKRLEAIQEVVDNSRIDQRYSVYPVDYIVEPRPL